MANRTPLYDWHLAHGARMVDFAGWDMPIQYTGIIDEHQAVRTGAGLFDISHMGRLTFSGPNALDLLQRLDTNDVASLKIGQAKYGLICNDQGGILDDVLVYRFEPFYLMVVNASNRLKILAWIDKQRGERQVTVKDMTLAWAMVAIQGPRALDIVRPLFAPTENLRYYFAELTESPDDPTIWSRTGYTGEDGFEIIMPSPRVVTFATKAQEIARGLGLELKPCGLGARDTLRLEAAMPLYGHELCEDIDPVQAGLNWAIKWDKPDFIGKEAIARRRQDPHLRRRVGLELTGKRPAREGMAVSHLGKEVGNVKSGTFAPTLSKAIAMAYVDTAFTAAGTMCEVDVRGKLESARVVSLPFYKRSKT